MPQQISFPTLSALLLGPSLFGTIAPPPHGHVVAMLGEGERGTASPGRLRAEIPPEPWEKQVGGRARKKRRGKSSDPCGLSCPSTGELDLMVSRGPLQPLTSMNKVPITRVVT